MQSTWLEGNFSAFIGRVLDFVVTENDLSKPTNLNRNLNLAIFKIKNPWGNSTGVFEKQNKQNELTF